MTSFCLFAASLNGLAGSLPERYQDQGRLVVTQLVNAPFPHPSRAEGHTYKDKKFSAKKHYSDSTVAVFIPKYFKHQGPVDLVVHFHGWQNQVESVLNQYRLIEQLVATRRNAILVVPQGPRNASDSSGGKLEDAGGFQRLVEEAQALLRVGPLNGTEVKPGRIILSGHSGGYKVMAAILDRGGLTDHVREAWLFDALYAGTDEFLAWSSKCPSGRLLNIYTDGGGTKRETENMMAKLRERGTAFLAGEDAQTPAAALKTNHIIFLHTALTHNQVVATRETFREFLATSCLGLAE